jgi:uncharacterized membrane protein
MEQEIKPQKTSTTIFNLILLFVAGIIFLSIVSGVLGFLVSIFVKAFTVGYNLW